MCLRTTIRTAAHQVTYNQTALGSLITMASSRTILPNVLMFFDWGWTIGGSVFLESPMMHQTSNLSSIIICCGHEHGMADPLHQKSLAFSWVQWSEFSHQIGLPGPPSAKLLPWRCSICPPGVWFHHHIPWKLTRWLTCYGTRYYGDQ